MNNHNAQNTLISLYKIVEAGEKGYTVVASNVKNRALKILFQTNSQQRLKFKDEIFAEIQRLGSIQPRPKGSILGMIHRGRIDIFATLTIGDQNVEKVLLKEVMLGESAAVRAYERTLKQELPSETRTLIQRQFQEVRKVVDQIQHLRGHNRKRLILRLYDTREDAEQAFQSLKRAGIVQEEIKIEGFKSPVIQQRDSQATTIFETILSGTVGGNIWGVAAGSLAAFGVIQFAAFHQEQASPLAILLTFLGLIAQGTFLGGMIGLFIGWGVSSQHRYDSDAVKKGKVLVQTLIDESLASKAWQIMNQVAITARARTPVNPQLEAVISKRHLTGNDFSALSTMRGLRSAVQRLRQWQRVLSETMLGS